MSADAGFALPASMRKPAPPWNADLPRRLAIALSLIAAAGAGDARAQGLFGLFQQGAANAYAPASSRRPRRSTSCPSRPTPAPSRRAGSVSGAFRRRAPPPCRWRRTTTATLCWSMIGPSSFRFSCRPRGRARRRAPRRRSRRSARNAGPRRPRTAARRRAGRSAAARASAARPFSGRSGRAPRRRAAGRAGVPELDALGRVAAPARGPAGIGEACRRHARRLRPSGSRFPVPAGRA